MPVYHCAVVIPTKNAMPGFVRVFEMVRRQRTPWPYEIIVIDSGSRDGTAEYVRGLPDVRLISVDPKAFGHGRTRNHAIAASDAPFVAFITHDAEPLDECWLAKLVMAVEQNDRVAGAFGRHVAYRNASPFTKRDLNRHFEGFLAHPPVVDRDLDREKYVTDEGWRQFLHFYSDNNSCMRRSVWERIPYPDVEFAEDQLWAKLIIEAGYAKAYAHDAVVYHSHNYGIFECLQRSFDESRNFQKYFSYQLAPNLVRAAKSAAGLSVQDIKYAWQNGELNISNRQVARQVIMNNMRVIGHYLGTRYSSLPMLVQRQLSRDERLQTTSSIGR